MKAKWNSRWSGVGRASVAVAGVCLTGSVASAWTTARTADFETEFEGGQALGANPAFAAEAPALNAAGRVLAADTGSTVWEQTLVGYLDKIVAKECDEAGKDAATKAEVVAENADPAQDGGQKDVEDATESAGAGAPAVAASEPKSDVNPDWDLEEPAAAVAAIDPDWDLAEAPAAVADAGADWDLEDGPVVVEVAAPVAEVNPDWDIDEAPTVAVAVITDDADWDLAESPAVATAENPAVNPDWDLDEPAPGEAVAATARETADEAPAPVTDQNPDWDIDEPTVAAASADEVTKVDSADEDFDLIP
jgi:hypothetical protein